jgi:hypothetical protein
MSQIIDSVEDGKYVFRKKRESPEEELFFNKKYFEMIGYPDVEVSIEIGSTEHSMKGGYYKNAKNLTIPFRHFVFLLQGNKNINLNMNKFSFFPKKTAASSKNATEPKTDLEQKGYFDRLFQYNTDAVNAIKTYLRPKEKSEEDKTSISNKPSISNNAMFSIEPTKLANDEEPTDVQKPMEEEAKPTDVPKPVEEPKPKVLEYWVVKIPIRKSDDAEPKGKYEKMEQQLTQFLLQEKVNKSIMLTMEYELKDVGDDAIYFYKGKEDNRMQIMELFKSGLKGSKMIKFF